MAVSLISSLLLLGASVTPAQAGLAAWWNGIGTQLILQNETTGLIRYSRCNKRDSPVYSPSDDSVFSLDYKPKKGTPLTGVGYWTNVITIASIYYVDQQNRIANALFHCNMTTGRFQSQGNWIVSGESPSINANTGLASVLLGDVGGYRVYYHDEEGQLSELGYTVDDNWTYRGVISKDVNSLPAIGAIFTGKVNISVATPRDDHSIAVTRYNSDQTWRRTTLPQALRGNTADQNTNRSSIAVNATAPSNFTLAAWSGTPSSIGVSVDNEFTRFVWYIGSDGNLYSVGNKNYFWSQRTNQSAAFWPKADKPNAELAVASESGNDMVSIYYVVNGSIAELKFENDSWKAWEHVALPPPEPVVQSSPAGPTSSSTGNPSNPSSGLSTGAKAGIGVGVSLGAIALAALGLLLFLARRRKKDHSFDDVPQRPGQYEGSAGYGEPNTPAPSYGPPDSRHHQSYTTAAAQVVMSQQQPQPQQQYDQYAWDQKNAVAGGMPAGVVAVAPEYAVVHQLDAQTRPTEMYVPQPMYELPNQTYSHELPSQGYSHELAGEQQRDSISLMEGGGIEQQQHQQHHSRI